MTALVIIEGVVIALLVLVVAGLLRSHADILRRLHALDGGEPEATTARGLHISPRYGSRVPDSITGPSPAGEAISVALRNTRGKVLLAFLSSGCSTCRPFWQEFQAGADMPAPDVHPVVVTKSDHEESPSRIAELAPSQVKTVMSSQAWDDFQIPVSPYFVLVDAQQGTLIGEGAAGSWDHVRDLLAQAIADAWADVGTDARTTRERSERTNDRLRSAGIEPGDPSLYRNPHEGQQ